jgi:dTDP-4-amino-4,6-dideoxygalactose transaminase
MTAPRIPMGATIAHARRRPSARFPSARAGFEAYLRARGVGEGDRVLLPAFIGWSAREGSGVMDPVRAVGATPVFHRMTRTLEIDLAHLGAQLDAERPSVLVLIHYFGWPDAAWREAAALAHERGIPVVEDEAHAWLSDLVGGSCGDVGEACLFSTHKLLPTGNGGELVANPQLPTEVRDRAFALADQSGACPRADYDLRAIAAVRRSNAILTLRLLDTVPGVEPLRPGIPDGVIPQTLPIVVHGRPRDGLYFAMNEAGFGCTSLYHTMVDVIDDSTFPDARWLARRIFNLPVHQDADPASVEALVAHLRVLLA